MTTEQTFFWPSPEEMKGMKWKPEPLLEAIKEAIPDEDEDE